MRRQTSGRGDKSERKQRTEGIGKKEDTEEHPQDSKWRSNTLPPASTFISLPPSPSANLILFPRPSPSVLHVLGNKSLSFLTKWGCCPISSIGNSADRVLMFNSLSGSQRGQQEIKKRGRRGRKDYHFFLSLLCFHL